MLDDGNGIFLDNGRLAARPEILQKRITSCARISLLLGGPGGEFKIPRKHPRSPLHVTVTPLRSKTQLADFPWIGVGTPVAIVTVRDPDVDRRRREINLRRRFGLTAAEAGLVTEILKGMAASPLRRGAAFPTRRPEPISRAFSRRPEPTGRPNSSVSCSTPPMRARSKHERIASIWCSTFKVVSLDLDRASKT